MTGSPELLDLASLLSSLFASGRAADLVLACLLAEGAVLLLLALRRGTPAAPILANIAAGAGLVLALRAALLHESWPSLALPLLLALAAHGLELMLRFRGQGRAPREQA